MREIRIYQAGSYKKDDLLELSPEASHHVALVLRMQPGQKLTLFCGDNREFEALIHAVKKKQVWVQIAEVKEKSRESPLKIHLAQAISKGERMEWVMQKSVELGVSSIRPLITERCVVKLDKDRWEKKWHQWQSIVMSACEQCGRNEIPLVHPPMVLQDYLAHVNSPLRLILDPESSITWRHYDLNHSDIDLLIGPEGGLSSDEIQQAHQHNFSSLTLGPRVLRTETAALAALSILQALGGDL